MCQELDSSLLNCFLDHLVCSDVKKVALGHSIVQAVRPKTVISPLMLGLTVSLDHSFGGKTWLISMLHRLGYILSYDELIRYKQSIIQCDSVDNLPLYPICYTQFVADNGDIAQLYINYLQKYCGGPSAVRVVFDGYCSGPTIKDHEHLRHSGQCAPDVVFDANKPVFKDQTAFLANEVNKRQFVAFLMLSLQSAGYMVEQANDDADTAIVSSALDVAKKQPVTVVTNDTDILVLLTMAFSPGW